MKLPITTRDLRLWAYRARILGMTLRYEEVEREEKSSPAYPLNLSNISSDSPVDRLTQ